MSENLIKRGGCGCAASGGKATRGCGCKAPTSPGAPTSGDVCDPCEEASFVRPLFFAGQLLTEDDLGALMAYTTSKQRLQNSRLFGDGVVCGLEVVCHPCGGGKVIVKPGYALDCCGNDLLLPCDRELDINRMVAALREHLRGGHDCGDPCEDGEDRPREYCLYLRYTERLDQPVASYPVGDDCATECQATRVLEGVTFELRCPEKPRANDILSALAECLPETSKGEPERIEMRAAERALARVIPAVREKRSLEVEKEPRRAKDEPRSLEPQEVLREILDTGMLAARLRLKQDGGESKTTKQRLDRADKLVEKVKKHEIDLGVASRILSVQLEEAAAVYLSLRTKEGELGTDEAFLAWGVPYTVRIGKVYSEVADEHDRALAGDEACSRGKFATECAPRPNPPAPSADPLVASAERAAWRLGTTLEETRRRQARCLCVVPNPPCPPCSDPAVLLACLEVQDCKVTRINNMVRNFVISPMAVRYWLPLGWVQNLLAELCSGPPRAEPEAGSSGVEEARGTIREPFPANLWTALIEVAPRYYGSSKPLSVLLGTVRKEGE